MHASANVGPTRRKSHTCDQGSWRNGQRSGLIIHWLQVRILSGPPEAPLAELADAADSKSAASDGIRVRVSEGAPVENSKKARSGLL